MPGRANITHRSMRFPAYSPDQGSDPQPYAGCSIQQEARRAGSYVLDTGEMTMAKREGDARVREGAKQTVPRAESVPLSRSNCTSQRQSVPVPL